MALKVLIIPDKFKGTLTATEAARAIANGWRRARPGDTLQLLPMSDGGEGFGELLASHMGARPRQVRTANAAHRLLRARWWWDAASATAVIESANIIGLSHLPAGKYHPFALDTFGLGAAIRAAAKKGATRCIIGIGGSATNDGGFGVARALGWRFVRHSGREITRWTELHQLVKIAPAKRRHWFASLTVAVDVQNPLLGPRGCTRVFGPQKGLKKQEFAAAERCLKRLAQVVKNQLNRNPAAQPGAGAAGGLGFGLAAFAGARLEPGFELFAKHAGLMAALGRSDVVVTGEGAMDGQSLMGKGVGRIAALCARRGIPCIGLAGRITLTASQRRKFALVRSLGEVATMEQATARAKHWLERLAFETAQAGLPAGRRVASLSSL